MLGGASLYDRCVKSDFQVEHEILTCALVEVALLVAKKTNLPASSRRNLIVSTAPGMGWPARHRTPSMSA